MQRSMFYLRHSSSWKKNLFQEKLQLSSAKLIQQIFLWNFHDCKEIHEYFSLTLHCCFPVRHSIQRCKSLGLVDDTRDTTTQGNVACHCHAFSRRDGNKARFTGLVLLCTTLMVGSLIRFRLSLWICVAISSVQRGSLSDCKVRRFWEGIKGCIFTRISLEKKPSGLYQDP